MILSFWQEILDKLQQEVPEEEFNIWLRPLQLVQRPDAITLYAPNTFIKERIVADYADKIHELVQLQPAASGLPFNIVVGNPAEHALAQIFSSHNTLKATDLREAPIAINPHHLPNPNFTFNNFVEGKSNQLARAAAQQVSDNPGQAYNPLFVYGGVGLGKTHLMHAIGNAIIANRPGAQVLYLHSENFVADMVKALQRNAMNEFKRYYRSADALLIDDIQFFAGKDRSQEEFFHTFNALLDSDQQIVLTSDRIPKAITGVEERLKSRFGWGLTVAVEPPELETRVAILISKAEQTGLMLANDVAFFIAKRIQSNVRELEGALKRVNAHANFTGRQLTVELAQEALKDLLAVHAELVSLENIQKTVAEYYKVRLNDLLSSKRSRSIALARQIAMALAKELTQHSLPEIGRAFGGRDHTTVLHACRKVKALIETEVVVRDDYRRLIRILST